MKPIRKNHDHEEYFTAQFICPHCKKTVGSYDYGRAWCEGPQSMEHPQKCRNCGEPLDWSDVPDAG